jgi:hypothetical protein
MVTIKLRHAGGEEILTQERLERYTRFTRLDQAAPGRYSWGFVGKLLAFELVNGIQASMVIQEILRLEGHITAGLTKPPSEFKHPPLRGLWHQHFFSSHFVAENIRLQLKKLKSADLDEMSRVLQQRFGSGPMGEEALTALSHMLTTQQIDERFESGLATGEWIIFAKHQQQNYYLTLSTHIPREEPGRTNATQNIVNEVKMFSTHQFPFLVEMLDLYNGR